MSKSTVSRAFIGLQDVQGSDQINFDTSIYKFLVGKKEAPVPKATVGPAQNLRERILVASIFPDIYTRNKK